MVVTISTTLAVFLTAVSAAIDPSKFGAGDVIRRDVVIVGGGATGAHAAVQLRTVFNKSIVLVEKDSLLV